MRATYLGQDDLVTSETATSLAKLIELPAIENVGQKCHQITDDSKYVSSEYGPRRVHAVHCTKHQSHVQLTITTCLTDCRDVALLHEYQKIISTIRDLLSEIHLSGGFRCAYRTSFCRNSTNWCNTNNVSRSAVTNVMISFTSV